MKRVFPLTRNHFLFVCLFAIGCDLSCVYFFRFLSGGSPLSNSDIDKLIDLDTNLPRPVIVAAPPGLIIPFFFTVFDSVTRSDFFVVDLEVRKKNKKQNNNKINTKTGN